MIPYAVHLFYIRVICGCLVVSTSFFGVMVTVGLVSGQHSDDLRAAVGRRLAVADHHDSQIALGDGEDSPLQSSKRSSTCFRLIYPFFISFFFADDQSRETLCGIGSALTNF